MLTGNPSRQLYTQLHRDGVISAPSTCTYGMSVSGDVSSNPETPAAPRRAANQRHGSPGEQHLRGSCSTCAANSAAVSHADACQQAMHKSSCKQVSCPCWVRYVIQDQRRAGAWLPCPLQRDTPLTAPGADSQMALLHNERLCAVQATQVSSESCSLLCSATAAAAVWRAPRTESLPLIRIPKHSVDTATVDDVPYVRIESPNNFK